MGILLILIDHSVHGSTIGRPINLAIIFILYEALDRLHTITCLTIRPYVSISKQLVDCRKLWYK